VKTSGILFSPPMVLANNAGLKTQSRRVVKGMPLEWLSREGGFTPEFVADPGNGFSRYGYTGDRLYQRETLRMNEQGEWCYSADMAVVRPMFEHYHRLSELGGAARRNYTPGIHMPQWAARTHFEVTGLRIERLWQITVEDVIAEGINTDGPEFDEGERAAACGGHRPAEVYAYASLWDAINGEKFPWEANPWVWVVSYRKVDHHG
jgi:hypothetical protein